MFFCPLSESGSWGAVVSSDTLSSSSECTPMHSLARQASRSLQYILGVPRSFLPVRHAEKTWPKRCPVGNLVRYMNHLNWFFSMWRSRGCILSPPWMAELLNISLESRHPSPEANSYCLYLRSNFFSHYPQIKAVGEGRSIDWPVWFFLIFLPNALSFGKVLMRIDDTLPSLYFYFLL